MNLRLLNFPLDERKTQVAMLCIAGVAFIACIASLMYLFGFVDGRLYATVYDAGYFRNTKVHDANPDRAETEIVEGEKMP